MKNYTVFVLVIISLVIGMLGWIGHVRLQDFKRHHTAIAHDSTLGIASETAHFIAEKKRLVELFAGEYGHLLQQLTDNPHDEALLEKAQERIRYYFPDYFAFTLTDAHGTPHLDDFDGMIGELCQQDIDSFITSGDQLPRIHPHSEVYHFDILAPYGSGPEAGILFISFDADILGGSLRSAQSPQHQTLLIHPEASQLIEATADGARINWQRNDYRLSDNEQQRILSHRPVPGSVWHAVDMHDPDIFSNFTWGLIRQSMFIFVPFMLVILAMLFYARREERLRRVAEQHKDEFLSVVSHELRTPLTSIRGSLSLIDSEVTGKLEAQTKSLAGIALSNTLRLETLVNDILDVQKIRAGKMAFTFTPVDLKPLLKRSLTDNKSYGEQFSSRFVLKDIPLSTKVNIDETRISQVMSNLLSNAAKYGAEEDTIEVSTHVNGQFVRVNVTDHGPGIPAEAQHRLFKKFEQLDSSDTRKAGGTGLGLTIVKLIVEAHGGKTGFDTQVGKGTTFYFDLPLSREAAGN